MMPNSTTIVRGVIDHYQVRMSDARLKEFTLGAMVAPYCPKMSIDPKDFPEMVRFEVMVQEHRP